MSASSSLCNVGAVQENRLMNFKHWAKYDIMSAEFTEVHCDKHTVGSPISIKIWVCAKVKVSLCIVGPVV